MASINLKMRIANQFIAVMLVYFSYEIVVNGVVPVVRQASSDSLDNARHWDQIRQQYFDLLVIAALLIVFRSRAWPEFFSIGLFDGEDEQEEIDETNNALVQQYRVVPYFKSDINRSFFEHQS
jgi:hypothetical protein